MFSGIVEGLGSVAGLERKADALELTVSTDLDQKSIQIGESIAVEGVCLTVTSKDAGVLTFDVVPETLRRTTLGKLVIGSKVNLERSLKVGDRISGHFVSGHIDATARLRSRTSDGANSEKFVFEIPKTLKHLIAEKGSITIAGVSLTVGKVTEDRFSLYLIPHTLKVTTLGSLQVGGVVNLEVDVLARYTARILESATVSESVKQIAQQKLIAQF